MIRDLGITKYQDTFSAMKDFVAKGNKEAIWLVEHEPVFTLGTQQIKTYFKKNIEIFKLIEEERSLIMGQAS